MAVSGGESPSGGGGFGFKFGASTVNDFAGAANDLFAAQGFKYKAEGAEFEKKNYLLAEDYANQNEKFTETSTAIKLTQQKRQNQLTLGGQQADVAGAGFEASGSALDLLRDSAQQGALTQAVLGAQGQITEAGYKEQAESYKNMASAADVAIKAAHTAEMGSYITAGIKAVAGVASVFA